MRIPIPWIDATYHDRRVGRRLKEDPEFRAEFERRRREIAQIDLVVRQLDEVSDQAAAHPVWSSDNEALKQEFRQPQEERDHWLHCHSRAEGQAERFQEALEAIGALSPEKASDAPQIALSTLERYS